MKRIVFGSSLCTVTLLIAMSALLLISPSSGEANLILSQDIYTVGSNPPGNALDPLDNPIGGVASISWIFAVPSAGNATLSIVAEGIDGGPTAPGDGEMDEVFFNGDSIGFLTQQNFYSGLFNLQPGPGALAGVTLLTTSFFDVVAIAGNNTVTVNVDSGNWINEIETSTLNVPEPSTILLLGFGLAGVGLFRKRFKN